MATYNRMQKVNGMAMVERSIISFLKQDYKDADLIILNDGSTDDTTHVLNKYMGHPKITIYNFTTNKLPPNNWNWLWEVAEEKGGYDLICQLHDDDELAENGITLRVNKFIEEPSLEVVYGGVFTQNLYATDLQIHKGQMPDKERIKRDEYINFVSLMYRPNIPFRFDPELRYYFDWLFKIRCLQECKVGYIEEPVMFYTVHYLQESNKCKRENMNASDEKLMREKLSTLYKWL